MEYPELTNSRVSDKAEEKRAKEWVDLCQWIDGLQEEWAERNRMGQNLKKRKTRQRLVNSQGNRNLQELKTPR